MKGLMTIIFNIVTAAWHAGKKFIEEHGKDAIDLTNKIKAWVNSPESDSVVDWIPGEWDNDALAWARGAVPLACDVLGVVVECDMEEGPIPYFQCIVEEIRKIDEKRRAGFYRDLAAHLSLAKAKVAGYEHKLTLPKVNLAIEIEYNRRQTDSDED